MICNQCGAQNPEDGVFCAGCGQPLQSAPYAAPAPEVDEAKDAEDNKLMGILAYLNLLVLVPIFAAPKSAFARYHANQGLILCILSFAYSIVYGIVGRILSAIFPYRYTSDFLYTRSPIYGILMAVLGLASVGILVLAVIGILNAVKGEKKELPLIGKFKILK